MVLSPEAFPIANLLRIESPFGIDCFDVIRTLPGQACLGRCVIATKIMYMGKRSSVVFHYLT